MPKPNTNFILTVDDLEMIESALAGKLSRRATSIMLDPDSGYADEMKEEVNKIRDLLGRLHNQKEWLNPLGF